MNIPYIKDMLNSTYDYKKLIELQSKGSNIYAVEEKISKKTSSKCKIKSRINPNTKRGV